MSLLQNSNAIESGGYNINNSLRTRRSANAYLSRTPASAGDRKTWTWSAWVKKAGMGVEQVLFNCQSGNAAALRSHVVFNTTDTLEFRHSTSAGSTTTQLITTQVFRDPSSWYHIMIVSDTTQATSSDRIKFYINGSQVTAFGTATYPSLNYDGGINQALRHRYASDNNGTTSFDGYTADMYFIDGQALTPSSFGEIDATTGVWKPKAYTGTYGTNGFYLKFSDIATTSGSNAGLGKDFSGNGNYWDTTNISVTSGTTYDAMTDVPTLTSPTAANYATLDPNAKASSITLSEGNLKSVDASGSFTVCVFATQTVFDKCYWEFQITNVGANNARGACGVLPSNYTPTTLANDTLVAGVTALGANSVGMCPQVSAIYQNGATTGISTGVWVANDVVMIAYDNGKLWMGRNGTWANSGDPAAGTGYVASGLDTSALPVICNRNSQTWYANFGQRPFSYTVPTGFKAFNTYNLPTPTILKANKYMDATLWTGNGSAQTITNAGSFKPDLVWWKNRNSTRNYLLFDSIRGVGNYIQSNTTSAEATDAQMLTSFNSDGFTHGTASNGATNGETYVGWQWQAGQGTTSSNTNGSITSTTSVNATAGFSIVTYTGTGANATVGHGLGVAPSLIIIKNRSSGTTDWPFYHSVAGPLNILYLNSTSAYITVGASGVWNSTAPSSTVFSIGTNSRINVNGNNFVAYCWAEIEGFSKFGSYTGNGNANGPFVYLGFRPKYVIIKCSSAATYNWNTYDSSRDLYNTTDDILQANTSSAEFTNDTSNPLDFLSNGFKIRGSNAANNGSGATFIYMAFAENPFKYSLAR